MNKHDKHHHSGGHHDHGSKHDHPEEARLEAVAELIPAFRAPSGQGGLGNQLEPEKLYVFEVRQGTLWTPFAYVNVKAVTEYWDVHVNAVASLGTATEIQIRLVPSPGESAPGGVPQMTATKVLWTLMRKPLFYPPTGRTFAGKYSYVVGMLSVEGTLAVNIETTPVFGGAVIKEILWYNPDLVLSSDYAIKLALSGGAVTLRLVTDGNYGDDCYQARSTYP